MAEANRVVDLVGMNRTGPNTYESRQNPQSMGNMNGTAYGGCALANLVHAAYQSLPADRPFHLYSALGHFLGPALCDRKIFAYVYPVRNTRTFFTCRVELRQVLDSGEDRSIMMALCDFQAAEPALMIYSAPPSREYSDVETAPDTGTHRANMAKQGVISESTLNAANKTFGLGLRYFEQRTCPEGVSAQSVMGLAKKRPTTQDHLPLTEKTSADWWRCRDRETLTGPVEHFAAAAFAQDAALSFIPLTHDHQFLDAVGACSSLDFALRFFKRGGEGGFNIGDWHLREIKTNNGAEGRTYTEARMWDQQGNMVSSMTQQSIMRVPKGGKPAQKL